VLELDLDKRVHRTMLRKYLSYLKVQVSHNTATILLNHLLCALRVLAPEHEWQWLRTLVRHYHRDVVPKNKQARLVTTSRLVDLGETLMATADADISRAVLRPARAYRDGLLIALLALRPLRRRTLAMIQIDKHLVKNDSGFALTFKACDTKNKQPLEYMLPEILNEVMTRYLEIYRPRFPKADAHDYLWASSKGGQLSEDMIYTNVMNRTRAGLGVAINLHLFRDCAASSMATECPEHVLAIAELLGHRDTRALYEHYIHANTMVAANRYQDCLQDLRQHLIGGSRKKANMVNCLNQQ
jgi:integrase